MRSRTSILTGIVVGGAVCLGSATTAIADDPDDAELRARRIIRAEPPWWRRALALPERSTDLLAWPIKKTVIWAEDVNLPERVVDVLYFNDERTAGWFPNLDLGGEIGTAAGVRLFHNDLLGGGEEVFASVLLSFQTFQRDAGLEEGQVRAGALFPEVGGGPFHLRAQVLASKDEDEDFFVRPAADGTLLVGSETRESDQTTYASERLLGRFEVSVRPFRATAVGLSFRPRYGEVRDGEGREPSIPTAVEGFGGPTTLVGGGPLLRIDGRDSDVRPRRGWFLETEGGYWESIDGRATSGEEYRYARYTVEAQRIQPTFRPDRVLFFRMFLDRVERVEGAAVPFWDLPALDEDHDLRAFTRNRFRDDGALLVNVEYRWPIWDTWDAFVFFDEGQVFHEYRDIEPEAFEWSGGIGARFYSAQGFLFRVHFATGEEQQKFRIGLQQEF